MMDWSITANFSEIKSFIVEYVIGKICSALGVGPRVRPEPTFDLICYEDAIQFYVEKCDPLPFQPSTVENLRLRLLFCLRRMHYFGLIHKDIKP